MGLHPFDPTAGTAPMSADMDREHEDDGSSSDKPYHSKRPHRKSRAGCKNCKVRKVKCDEVRPRCRACRLRREDCVYALSPASSVKSPSTEASSLAVSGAASPASQLIARDPDSPRLLEEPLFLPAQTDRLDMKLLWFYTTTGFNSFSIEAGRSAVIDDILTVKIPQHAFANPFLMNSLLGLAALQLQNSQEGVPAARAIAYRARAFEGYRAAIEEAKPETYPALLASSLLLCALASQSFREDDCKPLYIIDWMIVWRGIGLIVSLITPQALFESGMTMLFIRPSIDLDAAALQIPNNLLFMLSSIKKDDEDYPDVSVYYDTLKYLGSLYLELQSGFSGILDLRVITWFTFLPKGFVELARLRRPRALVVIAHYLAFVKLCQGLWWMRGISGREIRNIQNYLGDGWAPLLRLPRKSLYVEDRVELAQLILDNNTWEVGPRNEGDDWDQRATVLGLVDNLGNSVNFADGKKLVRADQSPGIWNMMKDSREVRGDGEAAQQPPETHVHEAMRLSEPSLLPELDKYLRGTLD